MQTGAINAPVEKAGVKNEAVISCLQHDVLIKASLAETQHRSETQDAPTWQRQAVGVF